jgi:ammonia channel protein AmtB
MSDRRRLFIIISSVLVGTLISAGLFFLRRGGSMKDQDYSTLITNMVFALAIVVLIGVVFRNKKEKAEKGKKSS